MKHRFGKNAKNRALALGGLSGAGFLVLLFFACSSLPNIAAPKSDNDTMLVFLAGAKKSPGTDYLLVAELQLDAGSPVTIHPWDKYTIITGQGPGNHKSLTVTILPNNQSSTYSLRAAERPAPRKFEIPFTLKPGTCTFFPMRFMYKMEWDSANQSGGVSLQPEWLSIDEIRQAYDDMKILKNFKEWKLDESVVNPN